MFFIVRCIFWLSLVYLNLPGGESIGVNATQFLDMARAHVGSFARNGGDALARQSADTLTARIADQGAEWCRTHGEACADAILTTMISKSAAAPPAPNPADTLTPADKTSRWHIPRRS